MYYHFKYYKDERGGYFGECVELEGCRSEGEPIEQLEKNLKEALDLYIDESDNSKLLLALSKDEIREKNILKIKPDANILFAQQLRILRLKHKMTQQQVAKKMGYLNVWAYQKYENHKASPTLKTLVKIKEVFPDLNLNFLI